MRNHAVTVLALAALFLPGVASAYIGPGAGLSAIGSLLALVGAVLLAIVGFVWYPIRRLLRRRKGSPAAQPPADAAGNRTDEDSPRK